MAQTYIQVRYSLHTYCEIINSTHVVQMNEVLWFILSFNTYFWHYMLHKIRWMTGCAAGFPLSHAIHCTELVSCYWCLCKIVQRRFIKRVQTYRIKYFNVNQFRKVGMWDTGPELVNAWWISMCHFSHPEMRHSFVYRRQYRTHTTIFWSSFPILIIHVKITTPSKNPLNWSRGVL